MLGGIVAFYFGGRFQVKNQEFKKAVTQTVALVPEVIKTMETLDEYSTSPKEEAEALQNEPDVEDLDDNAALMDWGNK